MEEREKGETFLGIVHPIEHDFWGSPVTSGHVACHDLCCGPAQTEIQDLDFTILAHTDITGFQILGMGEWGSEHGNESIALTL